MNGGPVRCAAQSGGGTSFAVERREELVERATGAIEIAAGQLFTPSLFEIGDGLSGAIEHLAALDGREDELCSAVGGIGTPFEVTEVLQFVEEFGAGRQTQLGPRGEVGEPDPVNPDVAPHVQVREPNIEEVAVCLCVSEQLAAELMQQPDEYLADSEAVHWKFS